MNHSPDSEHNRKQYWLNLTLAGVAGQVGCLTLIIILAAVLGGMWIDARFQTRPVFTMILLITSIPFSLAAMFIVVRAATSKIKTGPPTQGRPLTGGKTHAEVNGGRDT